MLHRLMAVAALLVVGFGAGQASAAIKTSISDGTTTRWFYNDDSQNLSVGSVTVGGYVLSFETTTTNFPGANSGGSMKQSLSIQSFNGAAANLEVHSYVIDNIAGAAFDGAASASGVNAVEIAGGDLVTLATAAEKLFTIPSSTKYEIAASSGGDTSNATSGFSQATTYVNTSDVDSLLFDIVNGGSNLAQKKLINSFSMNYTLSQKLVVSGVNTGDLDLNASGTSTVKAPPGGPVVPEPASLAIWSLGLGVAGLVRLRRKK